MSCLVTKEMNETVHATFSRFNENDEWELVAHAQAGSSIDFERLVEKYRRRILRVAQNITRNREDAEDAMQSAFVKAFRNISTFQGASRFYTWLVRITINEALMGIRRRKWVVVSLDDSDVSDDVLRRDEIEDRGPSPEERCSGGELEDILAEAMRALSPKLRIIFKLRHIDSCSIREIAQALSLSASAVKARLRRARLDMRRSLNNHVGAKDCKNGNVKLNRT